MMRNQSINLTEEEFLDLDHKVCDQLGDFAKPQQELL